MGCNSYSLVGVIISKINIFPNKKKFPYAHNNYENENHKKKNHLSQIKKILFFKKYNCMSKIFLKIHLKFYSNVTTHNQTYE